jgi:ribosomal protein L37AE/L43A
MKNDPFPADRWQGQGAAAMGDESAERQVPFYCPYCGEPDLRPSGPDGGAWQCTSCARAFKLRFAGVVPPSPASAAAPARQVP